jgi:uncharacterized protein
VSVVPADRVEGRLLDVLAGFVHELRAAGLRVSMTENLDAMRSLEHIDLGDREALRSALGATLVKYQRHQQAFTIAFDAYFSPFSLGIVSPESEDADAEEGAGEPGEGAPGADGADPDAVARAQEQLTEALLAALERMDREALRRLAAVAVSRFAGMRAGRPVGGTYYLYRTLRAVGADELVARLLAQGRARDDDAEVGDLAARLAREEYEARVRELRDMIEAEIRRRLVADRGAEAIAKSLRKPLPEDVEFMHASREEMATLRQAVYPLTRALAARLAQRRRRRHHGHLDFRRTVRASLSYGGVPADPKFRDPHPAKPEIMVVADVSGSVASFARFTLMFVYAMASQFSKVRSWVFIDGVDEVTRFFQESDDVADAVQRVNTEADVVWVDGHSDYGHALRTFYERHHGEVTRKTTIILLGDARNNYHAVESWVVRDLAKRARHVYWLNPEPRSYWDTGDSVASEYGTHCEGVFECRNLRQLQRFVATVAEG